MSIIGSLIGAGASLLGGVLSSSSKKKQAQQQYENDIRARNEQREYDRGTYDRLVVDAERAGFNPLTALRNGGGAYYNASSAAAPLSRQATAGVGSEIGNSLQTIGANWLVNFDPHADAVREQGARLIDAQIANLNASTAELTQRHAVTARGNGALSNGRQSDVDQMLKEPPNPARFGGVLTPEIGTPEATNPWPRDWGLIIDPNQGNAEQFEDRYGEFLGSIIGSGVTIYKDGKANILPALKNLPPPPLPDWMLYGNSNKRPRLKPPR